ncbi:MAG: hypothetical protein ACRD08_24125, partial [Acidimicrobiales bacterium]
MPPGTAATFRFLVYRVKRAPEHRPAAFMIGDTVVGETIDPIADLDDFVVHGRQDEEVVAVAEPFGAAGTGALGLWVREAATNHFLGQVVAATGVPATGTTGRVRLLASGDYVFGLNSALVPGQRFRGAYRFWSYAINRAPERLPVAVPIGAAVSGEDIDRAGDVDEFTLQGSAGAELNAFIQAGRAHRLEVAFGSGPAVAVVAAAPGDTNLFHRATGRFQLAQAGTYTLRVTGSSPELVADTGSFRFFIYPIDRRPEQVAEPITPGDTVVGEAIDRAGDVDEFTISGAAGDEFNALFRANSGSPATVLQLEAVDGAGTVVRAVQS